MKLLSVCMIVKNEEAVLARCLNSVKELADEIIIVDTGSTDSTKAIAHQFTDKIYDFKWCDDFSIARNESLKHAKGKWILVLDADEYLLDSQLAAWRDFLKTEQPCHNTFYSLLVINYSDDVNNGITSAPVTRLIPNHMGIRFMNPIHEQPYNETGQQHIKQLSFIIEHTGYQEQTIKEKNKHKRNMDIFRKMQKNGKMSAYDYFTLGSQYIQGNEEQKAIECYEIAIQRASEKGAWYPYCLMGLISLYLKMDKLDLSWNLIETKFMEYDNYPEYHSMVGYHYELLGFYENAELAYKKAFDKAEQNAKMSSDIWLRNPKFGFQIPATQLMNLLFKFNRNNEAIHWLSKLLQINTKDANIAIKLLEWLCHNDHTDAILDFLNSNYNCDDQTDVLFLLKITLALGNKELVDHYKKLISNDISFKSQELARFALIDDNVSEWLKQVNLPEVLDSNELNTWLQIAVGSVIWDNIEVLDTVSLEFKQVNQLLIHLLREEDLIVELNLYSKQLFLIAKDLFVLQRYEIFDQFVIKVQHPELLNMLANYFYSINMIETAMKYYSILLSQQQLNGLSCENLGFYHSNLNLQEEAFEFLTMALELDPKKRHLYYNIIKNADAENKIKYSAMFQNEYPQFKSINFVKDACCI